MQFNVLLIGKDTKQGELYANLIRDMVDCHIDVMTRVENAQNWVARIRYHLVVIDSPSASTLLERIKRMHPESSVIVISESPSIEEAVRTVRAGAEDYLHKPVNTDSFRIAVRRGIDRKALFEEDGLYARYLNLVNACQMISASLEEARVWAIVRSYLSRELRSSHAAIFALSEQGKLELVDHDPAQDGGMEEIFEIALATAGLPGRLNAEGASDFFRFIDRGEKTPGLFVFRFRCLSPRDCYYVCLSPKRTDQADDFESRLKILRAQIDVTGQNIVKYRDVREMAFVDDVTGLHNTRYLSTVLDREIAQYRLTKASFTILFIDVDKFKNVNDAHGHVLGSKVLYELGNKLRGYVRDTDSLIRYGGDEFVAILTPCEQKSGEYVAERIRRAVEKTEFLKDEGLDLKLTVSIGVAVFPVHASSKDEIIAAADQAMYAAKKESRNLVYVAGDRRKGPTLVVEALTTQAKTPTRSRKGTRVS